MGTSTTTALPSFLGHEVQPHLVSLFSLSLLLPLHWMVLQASVDEWTLQAQEFESISITSIQNYNHGCRPEPSSISKTPSRSMRVNSGLTHKARPCLQPLPSSLSASSTSSPPSSSASSSACSVAASAGQDRGVQGQPTAGVSLHLSPFAELQTNVTGQQGHRYSTCC